MPHHFLVIAALVTVQVLFGINYIVSKVVVEAFPPLLWASVRIVIATSIMFFYAFLTKRKHPVVNREFLVPLVWVFFARNHY